MGWIMPKTDEAIEYKQLATLDDSLSPSPDKYQVLDIILEPLLIISMEMAYRR